MEGFYFMNIRYGVGKTAGMAGTVADVLAKMRALEDAKHKEAVQMSLARMPYEMRAAEGEKERTFTGEQNRLEREARAEQNRLNREAENALVGRGAQSEERKGLYNVAEQAMRSGYSGASGLVKDVTGFDIGSVADSKGEVDRARAEYWQAQKALIDKKTGEVGKTEGDKEKKQAILNLQKQLGGLQDEIDSLENSDYDLTPEMEHYLDQARKQRVLITNKLNELLGLPQMEDYVEAEPEPKGPGLLTRAWNGLFGKSEEEEKQGQAQGPGQAQGLPVREGNGLVRPKKDVGQMSNEELMRELLR